MFAYLYEWLRDVSFYMILVTAVVYVLPSGTYRKYIHFFTGLVLIILLLNPIFSFLGRKEYEGEELMQKFETAYKEKMADILADMEKLEDMNVKNEKIKVEEIVIGP